MSTVTIANISVHKKEATLVAYKMLKDWVIWQFPQLPNRGERYAAVKPPDPKCHWFAAILLEKAERVKLLSHLTQPFESPEAVFDYLQTNHQN